jgi:hypothetical protein
MNSNSGEMPAITSGQEAQKNRLTVTGEGRLLDSL